MIRLDLVSVGMIEDASSVVLVFRASEISQFLIIQVGLLEGRAIAVEAEGIRTLRPLTHELAFQVIENLGASITQIDIHDYRNDVFFANIVLKDMGGKQLVLDARPSDAIALAIRSGAPIYASKQVMSVAGVEEDYTEDLDQNEDGESVVH